MTIIEYKNATDITIQFEDGYIVNTTYKNFLVGEISNPYERNLCKTGYLGEGQYKTTINGKFTPEYNRWRAMVERCYGKPNPCHITYTGCSVCEDWHCFQTFAKWHDENYYEVEGEKMHLEKDILYKGNRFYSPSTCIFVPETINYLFTKRQNDRGIYPIGVSYHRGLYTANCSFGKGSGRTWIGAYDNPLDAFHAYKKAKENYIKQVADRYKDKIPSKLYEALYTYEVEISD